MPPTYSPFWKPFEILGRFGIGRKRVSLGDVVIGPPGASDVLNGFEWANVATAEALYDLWGPPSASPWSGYHKPTLFAALDSVKDQARGPRGVLELGATGAPRAPAWADERTAIVLDLPNAVSVAYAAWLCSRTGHVPVVSFHNWPHAAGLVDVERGLAALLFYAPWVREGKALIDPKRAPPVLVLDDKRLGTRAPKPRDFDNRYFLLESDLPAGATLANAGIERLVYVRPERAPDATAPPELDDVNGWLHDLNERVNVHLAYAGLDAWRLSEPVRWAPSVRKTPFTTTTDPAFRGFRRNAAGGFGVLVPEPSSGGG